MLISLKKITKVSPLSNFLKIPEAVIDRMDIYSKNVPNFVYTPVSQFATIDNINQLKKEPDSFIDKYILKFKTAIYASIIFAVLSLPIS